MKRILTAILAATIVTGTLLLGMGADGSDTKECPRTDTCSAAADTNETGRCPRAGKKCDMTDCAGRESTRGTASDRCCKGKSRTCGAACTNGAEADCSRAACPRQADKGECPGRRAGAREEGCAERMTRAGRQLRRHGDMGGRHRHGKRADNCVEQAR